MTEKLYMTTHYADGTPSETREFTEEEYAQLLASGWTKEGLE